MIVTLTPNAALDITYAVESVTLGESHRIGDVSQRAGGKGVNVASVLTAMGRSCVAVAPVGGPAAAAYRDDLRARGVAADLVDALEPTRRSIAVVDGAGRATVFNEEGPHLGPAVWDEVSRRIALLAPRSSVLTISGSLPPGTDPDLVRRLTREAHDLGLRVVVDVAGAPLARALWEEPAVARPNLDEARQALDPDVTAADAAFMLADAGARAALVSDGHRGVTLLCDDVELHAWLPSPLRGNATGAGDALTASVAADLDAVEGLPAGRDAWADILRRGVAWSAAAVLQPVAGVVDPADVVRILPDVEIEEIRA